MVYKDSYLSLLPFLNLIGTWMNIIARTGVGKCNLLNNKFTPVVTLWFASKFMCIQWMKKKFNAFSLE